MPIQLRQLFASIIIYCQPANLKELWKKYVDDLIEDFIFKGDSKDLAIAKILMFLENYLIQNELSLSNYSNELPELNNDLFDKDQQNTLIVNKQDYNQDNIKKTLNNFDKLNIDQRNIFNTVIDAINEVSNKKLIFVDGPGGTEKTFLYNMILAYARSTSGLNRIAIA
ncbi:7736_t:CDS:1, partial [Ambispora leptoticha]